MGRPLPIGFQQAIVRNERDGACTVQTGDGLRLCRYRDYIGRDGNGQFFVLSEPRFEATFEAQDDAPERLKRPYTRRIAENV